MIDVRNIRESESEAYLRLLCDTFGLDFNRAYDVFFTEPYYSLDRKWALFDGPEMLSILTVTPIHFGWGTGVGIAGVATQKRRQREGLATILIQRVLKEYDKRGEGAALLFARDVRLYEANGFEALDRVIRAPVAVRPEEEAPQLSGEEIRAKYDAWALAHPDRLRRDDLRWQYWDWHYRICTEFEGGYLCNEVNTLREAIYDAPQPSLPLPTGTEWFGTTYMTDALEIPLAGDITVELYLMGRNVPGVPQLFMTDQF